WDAGLKQQPSCMACSQGITEMTFKLTYRTSSGDRNERIRVRANDKYGTVLYDSNNDGDHDPGLPVGAVRSFDVPYSATKIVITVKGKNHSQETVKASFSTRCNLRIGAVDGNSYIKFEIIGAESKAGPMC